MIASIDDVGGADISNQHIPDKYRGAVRRTVRNILERLGGYGDNDTFVPLEELSGTTVSYYDYRELGWSMEYLAENSLVNYDTNDTGFKVSVIDRYSLEALRIMLGDGDISMAELPNLVYYQPSTGNGYINGNRVELKKHHKKLFNALFAAAPGWIERKEIKKAVGTDKENNSAVAYEIGQAFSKLRKKCKTDATVIVLKGSAKLDARTYIIEA